MNVFEEFKRLALELEEQGVRYALTGGVAMAFYVEPRFTRDIDLLVDSDDFDKAKGILEVFGYYESISPWTFRKVAIELHLFLKIVAPEEEMLIDVLVAKDEETRRINPRCRGSRVGGGKGHGCEQKGPHLAQEHEGLEAGSG